MKRAKILTISITSYTAVWYIKQTMSRLKVTPVFTCKARYYQLPQHHNITTRIHPNEQSTSVNRAKWIIYKIIYLLSLHKISKDTVRVSSRLGPERLVLALVLWLGLVLAIVYYS